MQFNPSNQVRAALPMALQRNTNVSIPTSRTSWQCRTANGYHPLRTNKGEPYVPNLTNLTRPSLPLLSPNELEWEDTNTSNRVLVSIPCQTVAAHLALQLPPDTPHFSSQLSGYVHYHRPTPGPAVTGCPNSPRVGGH